MPALRTVQREGWDAAVRAALGGEVEAIPNRVEDIPGDDGPTVPGGPAKRPGR
jgi:hypothetical protein